MKKVLLVIDMQNDFVTGALKNPDAEAIVDGIVKRIESFDGEIIATRDTKKRTFPLPRENTYP